MKLMAYYDPNTVEIVDYKKYNKILAKLKQQTELEYIPFENMNNKCWRINSLKSEYFYKYTVRNTQSFIEIWKIENVSGPYTVYRVPKSSICQDTLTAGRDGYNYFNEKFKKYYKISINKAFTSKEYKDDSFLIKKCVPTQLDYVNKFKLGKVIKHCSKSDVSSAYPYQLTKSLPTMIDSKKVKGRVEPNEEYPFAFYINSHHLAIYNELNTMDFRDDYFYSFVYNQILQKWQPDDTIEPEDDITILCKKSEYSFKNICDEVYNERHTNKNAKLYMNATIGYFQRNNNPKLAHLSAVVIARCANDMMKRANYLLETNKIPLLINTDAIIWLGEQDYNLCTTIKDIGNFCVEYTDANVILKSVKAYQIENNDGSNLITRHSGLDKEISRNMKFGDILTINVPEKAENAWIDDEYFIHEL